MRSEEPGAVRQALVETVLLIWAMVLDRTDLRPDDDFFAVGGHSLLALRVLSRIRSVMHVEISVRQLFESRTPLALAEALEERLSPAEKSRIAQVHA